MKVYVVYREDGYGHVENIFGIYMEKREAEDAKDLMIKKLYEKNNKDNNWSYVEDIEEIEVDIVEIDANELVDIELGGYCE